MTPLMAEPESSTTSTGRPQTWAAFFLGQLYCLICLPPWIPGFLTQNLVDPSWQYALHEAFAQKWLFGTEVIFPYGPYGFVTTRMYHPATFPLMLAVWIALGVVFFSHAWRLARQFGAGPWGALLVSAIAVRVACVNEMSFLLSFLVMFLLWQTPSRRWCVDRPEKHVRSPLEFLLEASLIIAVGLLPLTKYTFVPATALVLAAIVVRDGLQARISWRPLYAMAATLAMWGLSGQPWSGLGDYLTNGFEIAKNYEPAMSLWESEPFDVAAVWLAAALVVVVPLLFRSGEQGSGRLAGNIVSLTVAVLLFLVWKFTFVRFHAFKVAIFFSSALLIALFLLLANPPCSNRSMRRRWIGVCLPAVLLIVTSVGTSVRFHNGSTTAGDVLWSHSQNPAAVRAWLQGGEWMQKRHRKICRGIRKRYPLADLDGTIDVVPDKLALVLARNDVRYRSRPMMQSYGAFSPHLVEQNAAHYRSPRGPDFVLFRVKPIDGRFPSLCDGRVWRELLRRYEVASDLGDDLLLRRMNSNRTLQNVGLSQISAGWNSRIAVPPANDGLIWCRVKISRNLPGKLASLLYKLPPVMLEVTTASGTRTFRFVPGAGESGFLLSPQVLSKEEFASLLRQDASDFASKTRRAANVAFVCFSTPGNAFFSSFYAESIAVEFERVTISQPILSRID